MCGQLVSKLRDGYRLPLRRLIAVNHLSEVSALVLPMNDVLLFNITFFCLFMSL